MKIKIKRGEKIHGPGDRSYYNSSTEIINIKKKFPPPKCTKIGCAHTEETCTYYKLKVASVKLQPPVFKGQNNCSKNNGDIIPFEKLDITKKCNSCVR